MKHLAIIITHPIQYYVPVFQLLAQQCELKVFYTWGQAGIAAKHDPGFGKTIAWDMPLLEGYAYELLVNTSTDPGSHHGKGIVNPDLIEKITAFAPDAILVYGYIYHSHFKVMRHFKGNIPIWFRGDSTLLDPLPWYKAIAKKLYLHWVYSYVDKAFYVGSNNKAYFKKYGLKKEQLVFAPHAIDNERFAIPRTAEVAALRQSLNIAPEDIVILFAGKLEPKKNPELLLEAFIELIEGSGIRGQESEGVGEQGATSKEKGKESKDEIRDQGSRKKSDEVVQPEEMPLAGSVDTANSSPLGDVRRTGGGVHLLFVGNGILEESLKLTVKNLALSAPPPTPPKNRSRHSKGGHDFSNNIHFLDFQNQSQMPVVYQACDVFCLPSAGPGETWGLAINEAMAAGKAIIASDQVGCAVDLIEVGGNGYIFTSNNIEILTNRLTLLLETSTYSKAFGKRSARIIDLWTFDQQVKSIINQLHEL